jgi:hypothetical protein
LISGFCNEAQLDISEQKVRIASYVFNHFALQYLKNPKDLKAADEPFFSYNLPPCQKGVGVGHRRLSDKGYANHSPLSPNNCLKYAS